MILIGIKVQFSFRNTGNKNIHAINKRFIFKKIKNTNFKLLRIL